MSTCATGRKNIQIEHGRFNAWFSYYIKGPINVNAVLACMETRQITQTT